jgi:hypothetical protein
MNIEFSFSKQVSECSTEHIFVKFYNWFKETNINHNVTYYDNAYNKISPFETYCTKIKNLDNGKYITISYWDRAFDILNTPGADPENCVNIITSSGVHIHKFNMWGNHYKNITITPFSYLSYKLNFERYIIDRIIPFENKKDCDLLFRGSLYNHRKKMALISPNNFTEEILIGTSYYDELNDMRICLSLDGAGLTCHRDMEILGVGSVLLRPELSQKFHDHLIPNFHYVSVENVEDSSLQWELINNKFNEIKNDYEYLKFISNNGKKWFDKNGTIDANVNILKKIVKIKDLI